MTQLNSLCSSSIWTVGVFCVDCSISGILALLSTPQYTLSYMYKLNLGFTPTVKQITLQIILGGHEENREIAWLIKKIVSEVNICVLSDFSETWYNKDVFIGSIPFKFLSLSVCCLKPQVNISQIISPNSKKNNVGYISIKLWNHGWINRCQ